MRLLIQRVKKASVTIDDAVYSNIGQGLLVFVGIKPTDMQTDLQYLVKKLIALRIFEDQDEKMNLSVTDIKGELLVVSQFTLYANCVKGNRPSFTDAAPAAIAEPLYESFVASCRESGLSVKTGSFGADMQVELINDGPVTVLLDSEDKK